MGRKEKNIISRRLVHSYLSSIISIALVLLLVGMFGMLAVNAGAVQNYFKENVKITAILNEDVSSAQARKLQHTLDGHPAVKRTAFISKEQGTEEMKKMLGEDFLQAFEHNPIPPSIEINLRGEYFNPDSISLFSRLLEKDPAVGEVAYERSLMEILNSNLEKIAVAFMVFIALLMFISFVLINNTVRLNVFARRFTIHTMKLVGATRSFIRAPFLVQSAFQGLFASFIAIIILVGLMFLMRSEFAQLFEIFRMDLLLIVIGIVIVSGLVICLLSTYFVVNKLISLRKDELYY